MRALARATSRYRRRTGTELGRGRRDVLPKSERQVDSRGLVERQHERGRHDAYAPANPFGRHRTHTSSACAFESTRSPVSGALRST